MTATIYMQPHHETAITYSLVREAKGLRGLSVGRPASSTVDRAFLFPNLFAMDAKDLNPRILKSLSIEGVVVDVFEDPDRDDKHPDHQLLVGVRVFDDDGELDRMLTVCTCHARQLAAMLDKAADYADWEAGEPLEGDAG